MAFMQEQGIIQESPGLAFCAIKLSGSALLSSTRWNQHGALRLLLQIVLQKRQPQKTCFLNICHKFHRNRM